MKTSQSPLARLALVGLCSAFIPCGSAAEFKFDRQTLTVPDGFEVQLVAQSPLVDRPIVADFDEQGRLYVADSSGSNDKVDKQLAERPHRIVRLEDMDGDGTFDRSVVFADKMMFPEGAMWHNGSLYVSAPPSIWKLTDTNGDGVADKREEWFQGKTLTGCANDLHGPYLGIDGWIYWCKGAFAEQTYERPGRAPLVTRAAHIFRRHPNGGPIEAVMTGGMDNPVDVVFTPTGERIFTTTFLQHPEAGRRDGLIHAIYGGVYGKVHDVLDGHKQTGDLLPVLVHMGAAAPSGLARYESGQWGPEFQNNLFAASFNLHKVSRHVLHPEGATFRTDDSDFLVSDSTDFHPTDVIEDADGSLLVIDTGGWYKLCCPTSQLWKPDVLGAIYRVRKTDSTRINDPRGLRLSWGKMKPAELVLLLGDSRIAVRHRAEDQLSKLGQEAVPTLQEAVTETKRNIKRPGQDAPRTQHLGIDTRRNAVWALTRIDTASARAAVRLALHDSDESVRHAAIHSASLWRDAAATEALLEIVQTGAPQLQRATAEALGRIGNSVAVPVLLNVAGNKHDRILEHSLTYALIEIGDSAATKKGLASDNPYTRRAALIALDQMDNGGLNLEAVAPLLTSNHPELKEAAWWIVSHRPAWAENLVQFFREPLAAGTLSNKELQQFERILAQFAQQSGGQKLISDLLQNSASKPGQKRTALRVIAQSNLKTPPAEWSALVAAALDAASDSDREMLGEAIAAARSGSFARESSSAITLALMRVAEKPAHPVQTRLEALAALPGGRLELSDASFRPLLENVNYHKPVEARYAASTALLKVKLSNGQLAQLAEALKEVGPLELNKLLAAFENAGDETLGRQLVSALRESKGFSALHPDTLRTRLGKFPPSVQEQVKGLVTALDQDAEKQKAHLDQLLSEMKDGDIRRGQNIFNSAKAACSSCHAIGYLGGKVGPDLTSIGRVRTERDLLESIVFPSASFVRSYEPMIVASRSGEEYSGILKKDASDEVILVTGPGAEVHIVRSDVAEMRPGAISTMPQGLDEQLTRQELADLLAFLKAAK